MKRPILNIITVALIAALTISFMTALPARSSHDPSDPTSTRILQSSEWLWLRGNITALSEDAFQNDESWEGHKNALENKLNAVENQIEAGAFDGSVNKLENDVKKSITDWITLAEAEFLKGLVDDVIDVIEGVTPPEPQTPKFELKAEPDDLTIEQGDSGSSTINVTSIKGFNNRVDLAAELMSATDKITLILDPSWVIPTPEGNTSTLTVNVALDATPDGYMIIVTGTSGTKTDSATIILIVTEAPTVEEDTTPPTIASVLRSPETPAYNQTVTVTAFVYDTGTPTPSGIKRVILNYSSGSGWTVINMTLNEGLYNACIPAFPFDTTVEYRVHALDENDNEAASSLQSYKVIDPYPPLLRIDRPAQGSYLSGTVAITVFMKDQNSGGESGFGSAELSINGTVVKTWAPPAPSQPDTYDWNTATFGPDGMYVVKLKVADKAGNVVEKSLTVTVDNTVPTAVINAPTEGGYLRLSTLIRVTGSDTNFDKMEVRIDDELVRTSFTSGAEVLEWNTRSCSDGVHSIALKVYDKAGNINQVLANVTVDNTPPSIGTPSWSPKEPAANIDIQINVTVTEPFYGSGVQNVSLMFKNKTMDDWQLIPMELENGNWTTTLSNQSDTDVRFFVEAFDKAGNSAQSETQKITVPAPAGFPLAWILAAIAVIGAGTGGTAYYVRRRRKKGASGSLAPPAKSAESPSLQPPAPAPARRPVRRRTQSNMPA